MDFKDKLKEVRKKRQLTLEDLSGLTGIPVSTLSSYEVGTRTPKEKQIKLIAEALKVSPFFFYDNSFSTDADVFLLLASLSLKGIIHFETENDEDGEIKPETLRIIVSDNDVIERLIRFIPLLQNKQGFEKTPAKYVKKNYKQYSDDLDDQINNTIINLITCDNVSDIVDNSVTSSQPDI
ncbi:MAG: helix-turn-helix transcriptional regulator, partial [Parasporobacterium sp.]|nr:helix-turn-helix transcriptional regulator [Parasporobacterium sp.]